MKFTRIAIVLMLLVSLFACAGFAGTVPTTTNPTTPVTTTQPPAPAPAVPMPTDISGHWAEEAIKEFVTLGHVKGYPDGTFKPDAQVTRAEFMKMVNKVYGFTAKAPITYSDVPAGEWYYDDVAIAKAAGYISGYDDNTMRPGNPISREEVAAIFFKLKKLTGDTASEDVFTDKGDISTWAKGQVGAVVKAGIMKGYPDKTFVPKRLLTRAEAVTVLRGSLTIGLADAPVPLAAPVVAAAAGGGGGGGGTPAAPPTTTQPPTTNKTIITDGIVAVLDTGDKNGTVTGDNSVIKFDAGTELSKLMKIKITGTNKTGTTDDKIQLKLTSYQVDNDAVTTISRSFPDMSNITIEQIFGQQQTVKLQSLKELFGGQTVTIKGTLSGTDYTSRNVTLVLDFNAIGAYYTDPTGSIISHKVGDKYEIIIKKSAEAKTAKGLGLTAIFLAAGHEESSFPKSFTVGSWGEDFVATLNPTNVDFIAQRDRIKAHMAKECGYTEDLAGWANVVLRDLADHSNDLKMTMTFTDGRKVDITFIMEQ